MRFVHVVMFVAVEVAPGADEFRVRRDQAHGQRERRDRVERQCVEFGVSRLAGGDVLHRMSVIVDGFDLHDVGEQIAIDAGLSAHVQRRRANAERGCDSEGERTEFHNERRIRFHGRPFEFIRIK